MSLLYLPDNLPGEDVSLAQYLADQSLFAPVVSEHSALAADVAAWGEGLLVSDSWTHLGEQKDPIDNF